ncbi:Lar family restriction alleviation protein [Enterobacter hormaechei]|uniref:Lar family restriction alleviation protein n=1 Tax=Enterobacter hormaechei TaxID=158836 RepID=UPI0034E9815C|nr:Lar family restriction alleviation protein [Enterobacter hormaechei]HCE3973782.1 Lar family restriction alleviation protein [Enterobacter hormaechei]
MSLPKPCPFCGGVDVSIESYSNDEWFFVSCHECGANGPEESMAAKAALAWERRAGDEETNV